MIDELSRSRFQSELKQNIAGDLRFDRVSRMIFATDASLYQIEPLGVVLPRSRQDLVQTVRTAAKYGIPILTRGGGTSLAGQTVTPGVVIDCSKYLTRVLEVNESQRWARVEPGVVLDNLNDFLRFYRLFFAPDVATSSRATLGGMAGNNSAGVRSVRYGKTVDHVLEMGVVLSTGEELQLRPLTREQLDEVCRQPDREGLLHREIRQLVGAHRSEIESRYPKVMRRVGGYNLDELLNEDPFNLAKLVVGSEGTLAAVTEIKVNLEPIPASKLVCVLHFRELLAAVEAVQHILKHDPSAVEIMDPYGIRLAFENPTVAELCRKFIQGSPKALLVVEFSGDSESEVKDAFSSMQQDSRAVADCYAIYEGWKPPQQEVVWEVRKNALGVLLSLRGDAKPLPFVEDACVPVPQLKTYIEEMLALCERHNRPVALYAHASVGVIHVRPILNLKRQEDVDIMKTISQETFQLVQHYGGSWSGEHGDGLVRSYKNREFFGENIYRAFGKIKQIFDPLGLMNPDKIVGEPSMTDNLRIHPGYRVQLPPTHFKFAEDGGFDRAVEMCTGVGQCRKTLGGTMCPSYMATRDEEHSTRGRANALRAAMTGELGPEGFTSHRLYEVLDLCLECKACKSECPSSVDMARLKAEFLGHYYRRHGLPLGKRLIANLRAYSERGSRLPWLANFLTGNSISRWVMERAAGLDRRRSLPSLSPQTLSRWFSRRPPTSGSPQRQTVVLFADTFTNFFQPEPGRAAVLLLERLGFRVTLAEAGCCGRPLISAGLLDQAARQGNRTLANLIEVSNGAPILVLEPSCLVTMTDDLPDLVQSSEDWTQLKTRLSSLEQFLCHPEVYSRLHSILGQGPARMIFHGHCQQSALFGKTDSMRVLQALDGCTVTQLDSGCCGMAGAFGYEKEHYALSEKIGARRLFPAIKNLDYGDAVVACGFSCRSQIEHFASRRAFHPAEVLAAALTRPEDVPPS